MQELPLDGAEELEVDVTCDEAGYVQVSQQRIKVKAGRLRKTSIILRRSDIVLRAIDGKNWCYFKSPRGLAARVTTGGRRY